MLSALYKVLWSHVGGRYWTWIAREGTRTAPLQWLLAFLLVGILIGYFAPLGGALWMLVVLFIGMVIGHIWWSSPPDTWHYPGGPDG